MPETYVREMVADWMGASMAYTGKPDIQEWLNQNHHKMLFHNETIPILRKVLGELDWKWPDSFADPKRGWLGNWGKI